MANGVDPLATAQRASDLVGQAAPPLIALAVVLLALTIALGIVGWLIWRGLPKD